MNSRDEIISRLKSLGIKYELVNHEAAFTMDEYNALGFNPNDEICKNLFLRDSAGKRHFLVTLPNDKVAPLKAQQQILGTSRLSFASQKRLAKYLNLVQGEVTPLGILNDDNREVELVFDAALEGNPGLGVHPNDNTATVWISFADLYRVVEVHGNRIHIVVLGD